VKTESEVAEKHGLIGMTRGTKRQSGLMELNGLIQVSLDTLLLESVSKAIGKIVER
jgi:hypothetical protein